MKVRGRDKVKDLKKFKCGEQKWKQTIIFNVAVPSWTLLIYNRSHWHTYVTSPCSIRLSRSNEEKQLMSYSIKLGGTREVEEGKGLRELKAFPRMIHR